MKTRITVASTTAVLAALFLVAPARAEPEPERMTLMQTLSGWMYPDSKMPHGASMSDGGNRKIQSVKLKAILTTPDPIEKVIEFYTKKLDAPADPKAKDADAKSVITQDVSKGRPLTLRVIVVNKEDTTTTLVISRAEGEKETHIAWTHYRRFPINP